MEKIYILLEILKYQLKTSTKCNKIIEQNSKVIEQNSQIIELLQKIADK